MVINCDVQPLHISLRYVSPRICHRFVNSISWWYSNSSGRDGLSTHTGRSLCCNKRHHLACQRSPCFFSARICHCFTQIIVGGAAVTLPATVVTLPGGAESLIIGATETEDANPFLSNSANPVISIGGIIASLGGFASRNEKPTSSNTYNQFTGMPYNGSLFDGSAIGKNRSSWIRWAMVGLSVLMAML
jgi:hypothetical protein